MRETSEFDKKRVLESFSKRIPDIRRELNLSQTELGEKLGISRQSVSSIERGVVQLTWDTFLTLLMIVMVSDTDLYNRLTADEDFEGVIEELKRRE